MTSDVNADVSTDTPVFIFKTDNSADLRKVGLMGDHVWWWLRDSVLEARGGKGAMVIDGVLKLQNEEGGKLLFKATDIERMRVGYTTRRSLRYATMIWRKGAVRPLRVHPNRDGWTAYAPAMRGLAALVAERPGGLYRIERGWSRFAALSQWMLLALPLGWTWLLLAEFLDSWWWGRALALWLLPAMLVAYIGYCWKTSPYWPCRLRDLAELDDQLPHVLAGTSANIYVAARSFWVCNDDDLRALGLAGDFVWVMPIEGALELRGDKGSVVRDGVRDLHADGGTLRIAAAEVTVMRMGFYDSKYGRHYQTFIWREGSDKPLKLVLERNEGVTITQTMQAFAASVAAQRGMHRVRVGGSKFDALLLPLLLCIPMLGAVAVALFVITKEPWWGRMILAGFPTLIVAGALWYGIKYLWPRPIRALNDLDHYLPPLPR